MELIEFAYAAADSLSAEPLPEIPYPRAAQGNWVNVGMAADWPVPPVIASRRRSNPHPGAHPDGDCFAYGSQ